jgi:hypothetical protein
LAGVGQPPPNGQAMNPNANVAIGAAHRTNFAGTFS